MVLRTHYSDELSESTKGKVTICGWVHDVKDLAKVRFVWLRDSHGIAQLTIQKSEASQEILALTEGLNREAVISVVGEVIPKRIAKVGSEVKPLKVTMLSKAATPLPLDVAGKTEANLDVRLDWRSIDLRRREVAPIFRIQSKLLEGMQEYLRKNGYVQVFTPSILGGISEGGAEVFRIDYYGREAYLRQDPQLHRQLLIAAGFEKIYDIGPSWRAELSHTPRHLCEHRTIAVELAFMSDESDMMRVEQEMVAAGIQRVIEKCGKDLSELKVELETPKLPFPELRFPKIYDILSERGKKVPYGEDYDRESELLLGKYVKEEFGSDFFFVNRFPFKAKPFYVMRVDEEPTWARSVDLLYRGLELSSGGQREHRHEKIIEQIKGKGVDAAKVAWFTDAFKYGVPPHGGFSLGIERLTMELLGLSNLREAVLFPRTPERLVP